MHRRTRYRCLAWLVLALPLAARADHAALAVDAWPLAAGDAVAAQPGLATGPDGDLWLSWIERTPNAATSHRLRLARLAAAQWSAPRDIAAGSDFFVNWADTPHTLALADGSVWAHWLRRNGDGPYDYGIALVRSDDDGATWSAAQRVEPAGAKLDYGFAALWEHAPGTLGIAWLDAREKAAPDGGDAHAGHAAHGSGGAMTLRAASYSARVAPTRQWRLDASTCDCCPTAVAMTREGPVLAYRGRSADEIRDIRVVRFGRDGWSAPHTVHDDGWRIAGCPVNGPGIAANDGTLAVAWYTEAGGAPSVRLARSDDAGRTFSAPRTVAEGGTIIGRVALAAEADRLWLAWLASAEQGQALWLAAFDASDLRERARMPVATLRASGAASGLPRLATFDGGAALVWTDVVDGTPRLRGARVRETRAPDPQ